MFVYCFLLWVILQKQNEKLYLMAIDYDYYWFVKSYISYYFIFIQAAL